MDYTRQQHGIVGHTPAPFQFPTRTQSRCSRELTALREDVCVDSHTEIFYNFFHTLFSFFRIDIKHFILVSGQSDQSGRRGFAVIALRDPKPAMGLPSVYIESGRTSKHNAPANRYAEFHSTERWQSG